MPDTPVTNRPPSDAFGAGLLIAQRYRLESRIATGGMAEVWLATDQVLGRQVAMKILHPYLAVDASFVARFRIEAIAAARLHHPGIIAIYDTCHDDACEAIVMALVRGPTLRAELDKRAVLPSHEVRHIGVAVADALEAAHQAGVIHRDIKPANILLSEDHRVLITDFGIAKMQDDPNRTQVGTMIGTMKYLAPEQVQGRQLDGRVDIYALGIVMYEALCGQPPFQADSPTATALARLHEIPPSPRQICTTIAVELDRIVMHCLNRDPDQRFSTAAELRAALVDADLNYEVDETVTTSVLAADPVGSTAHPHNDSSASRSGSSSTDPDPDPVIGVPETTATDPRPLATWLLPILGVVIFVGGFALAGVLFSRTGIGHDLLRWPRHATAPAEASPFPNVHVPAILPITQVESFDPGGRGDPGENDAQLAFAIDDNPSSSWITDSYDQRTFGFKSGVGIVIVIDQDTSLDSLEVHSPTSDWAASIYVADSPGSTLGSWGHPVDAKAGLGAEVTFDLGQRTGQRILIWITDLGDGPARMHAGISQVVVRG